MPRLSYRGRLFLALLLVSAIPVGLMTAVGFYSLRAVPSQIQPSAEIERIAETFREMDASLVGTPLAPAAQQAIDQHELALSDLVTRYTQAQRLVPLVRTQLVPVVVIAALVLLVMVAWAGGSLARQLASPLDELVDWTGRIKSHQPLPTVDRSHGSIAEFEALRSALYDLAQSLDQARAAELEAERLRTFGEVARRVAHEMKNPLTPIRLAVLQLRRTAQDSDREALEVIAAESARLEAMAREFAELGRLPETVVSAVDLRELLEEMLRATVPDTIDRRFTADQGPHVLEAHYDPLRRAFSNVLRNALEASNDTGTIAVSLSRDEGDFLIEIADTGPGIDPGKEELIFQPYYTDKGDGTGLGLAIVRQTIEHHGGSITVRPTEGGGATFCIRLPT